jgi:hypothetical protein
VEGFYKTNCAILFILCKIVHKNQSLSDCTDAPPSRVGIAFHRNRSLLRCIAAGNNCPSTGNCCATHPSMAALHSASWLRPNRNLRRSQRSTLSGDRAGEEGGGQVGEKKHIGESKKRLTGVYPASQFFNAPTAVEQPRRPLQSSKDSVCPRNPANSRRGPPLRL